jgi:hypothetical protein
MQADDLMPSAIGFGQQAMDFLQREVALHGLRPHAGHVVRHHAAPVSQHRPRHRQAELSHLSGQQLCIPRTGAYESTLRMAGQKRYQAPMPPQKAPESGAMVADVPCYVRWPPAPDTPV